MRATKRDGFDRVARAMADPTRRRLMERLANSPGLTTGELSDDFRHLSRWAILKHLGVLRNAALIETLPEGRRRRHYLSRAALDPLVEWLGALRGERGPSAADGIDAAQGSGAKGR